MAKKSRNFFPQILQLLSSTLLHRSIGPISDASCQQKGPMPLSYSHQTLQMMSSCPVAIALSSSYAQSSIPKDCNDEFYRTLNSAKQTETVSQSPYYPVPYPVHPTSQVLNIRSLQPIQVGLSPLDFIRTAISPLPNCEREANHRFMVQHQKGLLSGYCGDQYYPRPSEISSLCSFSDDNCESGATTPASERSMGSNSGLSSRSSMLSVASDASICSNNGPAQIFSSQSAGPYYKQPQPPHFIVAS